LLSLLRACKEAPDDDTPRLVRADWLQENGDAADAARTAPRPWVPLVLSVALGLNEERRRGLTMATLIVENVPAEVYERLRRRAEAQQRTPPQELLRLLEQVFREEDRQSPRLPDFLPGQEVPAPCDLPRSSQPVFVAATDGRPRLPDPLPDEPAG
jgi:uncharacterized protein (TIGR02996 family)